MMRILFILLCMLSFGATAQTVQTIGSPGTRVNSRGDFISDSIFYLPRTQVTSRTPFQSGAIRYQASDSSIYQWTGTAWRKISGTVDSLLFSTRAWRQKGIDSLASVSVGGSGTTNRVPKFTGSGTIGDGSINDLSSSTRITISSAGETYFGHTADSGNYAIQTTGNIFASGRLSIGSTSEVASLLVNGRTQASTGSLKYQTLLISTEAYNQNPFTGIAFSQIFQPSGTGILSGIGGGKQDTTSGDTKGFVSIHTNTGSGISEKLRVLANGNTGIGTTAPEYPLDVTGTFRNTGTALFNTSSGESFFGTTSDAGDYRVQINGNLYGTASSILAATSGNVRIGTTTLVSYAKLHVRTADEFNFLIGQDASAVGVGAYNNATSATVGMNLSGNPITFAVSGERMRITNTGNIGVGTNAPAYLFDVAGSLRNTTSAFFNTTSGESYFGTTSDAGDYRVQVNGNAYLQNGQMFFNQVTDKSAIFVSQYSVTGSASSNMVGATATWNTTGNPNLINIDLTNTASGATANYINISDGTNTFRVNKSAEIFTSAPTGGSSKGWRLGEVATVTPTSPNRTIRVEIDGVVYYIHAKTTND